MAFESKLDGPDTGRFESRTTAEDWFGNCSHPVAKT